jgi:4-amino-4-deoxy-L-arabinose transferase-like glycosyltransferase
VGVVLRLALVWAVGTAHEPVDDEWAYRSAEKTAHLLSVWWPKALECRAPGYPLFLRGLFVLGVPEPGMLVLQALLGTATLALTMTLARTWMGSMAAVVAGAILAVHPTLLMYTVLFMSETLFLFYLLGFFVLFTWPDASRRTTAAAGVFLGLSILTRSTLLPFVGILLLWTLASSYWPRAERRVRALWLVAPMLLTIAPWTLRNAIVYHELIPIDCLSMQSLWQGNNPDGWNVHLANRYDAYSESPREREQLAFREASAFLRAQTPLYPFIKLGMTTKTMLGQQDFVSAAFYLPHERFGPLPRSTASVLIRIERYYYVGLTALGLIGFVMAAASPPRALVGILAASLVVSHTVTFFFPRHRVPLIPFIALFAAVALCRPGAVWRPTRTRILAAVIAVALFALAARRS